MENGTMIQYFEWYLPADSSLWKQVSKKAKSLSEAGFTAVWLPPAYKGAGGVNDVGYGVYDLYDIGEFNQKGSIATKYGTRKEYENAIKSLHKYQIEALADIVFNQRMGADEQEEIKAEEFDPNDRVRQISDDETIKVWTKFNFPGRKGKYNDYQWDWKDFTATDYDASDGKNGLFRFKGKQWDQDVDSEKGNFDYLMGCDTDFQSEVVKKELFNYGKWYLSCFPVDGFRIDAVKHIDYDFFKNWLSKLREETGKELFAVGEYWNGNVDLLNRYIEETNGVMHLFDVTLHFHFKNASEANGNYDMTKIFDNTLVGENPTMAVTFVDNHDSQPGQALESWIDPWFKPLAYSLILLRENGYPCVFYGDYYGIPHDGYEGCPNLRTLVGLRKNYSYGAQHDYFDDHQCIGWTREGESVHPNSGLAVLMTIGDRSQKRMYIGKQFAGKTMIDALNNVNQVVEVDADGTADFLCIGGSVSAWILK